MFRKEETKGYLNIIKQGLPQNKDLKKPINTKNTKNPVVNKFLLFDLICALCSHLEYISTFNSTAL